MKSRKKSWQHRRSNSANPFHPGGALAPPFLFLFTACSINWILMNRVAVQFLDQGFHRMLFDAMPLPVFVVDEDVHIMECNAAATRLFGPDKQMILKRRGGEVLHCVNAKKVPEGCGHAPACHDCPVRNAVQAAARGQCVTRRECAAGTGCRRQDHPGGFANKLQSVRVRTSQVHPPGS